MKKIHLGVAMATALLAGCAGFTGQGYVDELNAADVAGPSFTQALAREYREIANFEWKDMMDYRDGQHFARKGLAAAAGETVLPDEPASRDLPDFSQADIGQGFTRLNEALTAGAREHFPEAAAKAQAKFDCWMEQQEENHQPEDIASCRQAFEEAMAQIGPAKYLVFFDFGSAKLTPAGRAIIKQAAADAKARNLTGFDIVGHTDTVGSASANRTLALARAASVRAALVQEGVKNRAIHTVSKGESAPMVPTADGVKEASNRRAEITIK